MNIVRNGGEDCVGFWVSFLSKRILKNKLKNIDLKHLNNRMIASEVMKTEKELRRKIFYVNITIVISIIFFIMILIVIAVSSLGFMSSVATVGSFSVLEIIKDNKNENNKDSSKWEWEKLPQDKNLMLEGSGGLYPKDQKLRLRAELIESIKTSVIDANMEFGVQLEPAYILGNMYRETGNKIYDRFDTTKISSIYKDLIIFNPACTKEDKCSWIRNNESHFYGKTVSDGVDTGNPYLDIYNNSKSLYDKYGGNHALGLMQFEIPYIYSHLNRVYKNPKRVITNEKDILVIQSQMKKDNSLGFIRPNIFYVPDVLYSASFTLAQKASSGRPPLRTEDFKSLSTRNKMFIRFMYAASAYGKGSVDSSDDEMAEKLIALAKAGKITNLDEMLKPYTEKFYNSKRNTPAGDRALAAYYINKDYNLGVDPDKATFYGIYAATVGRVAYDEMLKVLASAEKEAGITGSSNGNWIGRPGSGRFGNSGSKYYLESVGIRWYHQTHNEDNYSEKWGQIKLNGLTRSKTPYKYDKNLYEATLGSGGCGIYTIAMIASNLYNKDITPDIVRSTVNNRYVTNCLTDAGVMDVVPKLGLSIKTLDYTTSGAEEQIKNELKKGNMILFVGKHGPKPWYNGEGHFMALRGITDDGKLLGITSVGSGGKTAEQLMQIPIDYTTWYSGVSRNRNYVWVIGVK